MIDEFVDRLETRCGDSLRVVAAFESLDYELVYFRDDLRDQYSTEEIDRVYQQVIADGLTVDRITTIMDAGSQQARISVLEEAVVFVFPSDRYEGIFVTVDRDGDAPILDVVDVAERTLPTLDESV